MSMDTPAEPRLGNDGERCLTLRAAAVGIALLAVGNLWVMQAELITVSCQVSMSVPPIPALMGLIFLLMCRPLLGRIVRTLSLRRGELLLIYGFLALGMALASGGALRQMVPNIVALQYFASPENDWGQFRQFIPAWMAPTDDAVLRGFFEGSEEGVPWGAWAVPLGAWLGFVMLLFAALHFMAELFVDHWRERERLSFALNEIPLMLTADRPQHGALPLWKDPVMWVGFGIATLHNGLNILHAFNPSIPALGLSYDVGALFQDRPLNAVQPLIAWWRPEVLGFGYLMPLEVVGSALLAYGLLLAEAVAAAAMGYDIPRFPHFESQAGGCFIGMALIIVWLARGHIAQVMRAKPMVVWGLLGACVATMGWWWAAGMSPLTVLGFFGLVFMFALSYSRLRAEAGVPLQWAFPVTEQYRILIAFFGSRAFYVNRSFRNLTLMSVAWFLPRGYLSGLGAYQFEGLDLAHRGGVRRGEMASTLVAAVVLGTAMSLGVQLMAYYQYGANFLEGGTHSGGMRVGAAKYAFNMLAGFAKHHDPTNLGESIAVVWGLVATLALSATRHVLLSFPIHPLGFVLGTVRGYRTWAPLALAAGVKTLVLRVGGVGLYRRLVPAALGVVLGHFVMAGGVWSIAGAFGGEAFRTYQVWFG